MLYIFQLVMVLRRIVKPFLVLRPHIYEALNHCGTKPHHQFLKTRRYIKRMLFINN